MKKKLFSLLTVFALILSLSGGIFTASAASGPDPQYVSGILYKLGLMKGTGTNSDGSPKFELERGLTRNEAITMLVRLLGEESTALSENLATPFTDVESWAKPYVGYAYEMGFTNGTSATTFGGSSYVTANEYLTFVLRALGYTSGKDFSWETPWQLSDSLGLTKGQYNSSSKFLRADTAMISYNALEQSNKRGATTLLTNLVAAGAVTNDAVTATHLDALLQEKVMEAPEIIAKSRFAVFSITTYDKNGAELSTGSGFFISSDGKAVTSYNIFKDAYSAKVKTFGGAVFNVLGIFDYNEAENISLIKVNGSGFETLEKTDRPLEGYVFALYYPYNANVSVTKGSKTPLFDINGANYFVTDMTLPESSAGGPILNCYGEVVGIQVNCPKSLAVHSDAVDKLKIDRLTYFDKDAYYSALPSVPDFGAHFGFEALTGISKSPMTMYLYNNDAVKTYAPDALAQYKALLESKGFTYHGTFDGPETSGYLYMNGDMSLMIYFGTVKIEGTELILVTTYSLGSIFQPK